MDTQPNQEHGLRHQLSAGQMAMLAVGVEIFLVAFVLPGTSRQPDLSVWEALLTAVVACYFGTRS